jgi:hypothetical protein
MSRSRTYPESAVTFDVGAERKDPKQETSSQTSRLDDGPSAQFPPFKDKSLVNPEYIDVHRKLKIE